MCIRDRAVLWPYRVIAVAAGLYALCETLSGWYMQVDGRRIGDGRRGCVAEALQNGYSELVSSHVDSLSTPPAVFPDA